MKTLVAHLKALADPTRLKIVRLLLDRELAVCELAAVLNTSQPAVSQHLRRLKALGLVNERHEGTTCFCSIDRARLLKVEQLLRQFFDTPLDGLPDLAAEVDRMGRLAADERVRRCRGR